MRKKSKVFDLDSGSIRKCTKKERDILDEDLRSDIEANINTSDFSGTEQTSSSGGKKIARLDLPDDGFSKEPLLAQAMGSQQKRETVNDILGIADEQIISVFCDGSCSNNGKHNAIGGIGIVLIPHTVPVEERKPVLSVSAP